MFNQSRNHVVPKLRHNVIIFLGAGTVAQCTGTPASHIEVQFVLATHFLSSLLCTWEGSIWHPNYLCPCNPHRKPRWNFWLWPGPAQAYLQTFGEWTSKWKNLSYSVSISVFQINQSWRIIFIVKKLPCKIRQYISYPLSEDPDQWKGTSFPREGNTIQNWGKYCQC